MFASVQFIRLSPTVAGALDKRQVHFHFRPVRPADIVVSLDPISKEVNLAAGTYGVVTREPLTIGLHIHRQSYDSVRNIAKAGEGTELVVALPSRELIYETWITAMPIPRGINEADLAKLHLIPSHRVAPPSIAECPVNMEVVIEKVVPFGIHYIVFCRVLGATVDERFIQCSREEMLRIFPTHECDDIDNTWGGAVERLSLITKVIPAPSFPCGPRAGAKGSPQEWLDELYAAGLLSNSGKQVLDSWLQQLWASSALSPETMALRENLSRAFELIAWEEFENLQTFLKQHAQEDPL